MNIYNFVFMSVKKKGVKAYLNYLSTCKKYIVKENRKNIY